MTSITATQLKEAEFHFAEALRDGFGASEDMIRDFIAAANAKAKVEADRREAHLQGIAARGLAAVERTPRAWYPYPQKLDAAARLAMLKIALAGAGK